MKHGYAGPRIIQPQGEGITHRTQRALSTFKCLHPTRQFLHIPPSSQDEVVDKHLKVNLASVAVEPGQVAIVVAVEEENKHDR